MAVLTDYKGLDVVESASGAGGVALTDNFKTLADRAPFEAGSDPGVNDDSGDGFAAGDQWLNTSSQTMWMCLDASAGAAVWQSLFRRVSSALVLIPAESSDNVGIGTTSPAATLHVENNLSTDVFRFVRQSTKYFSLDFAGSTANFESDANCYWHCLNGIFLVTQDRTDATSKAARLGVPHYTNSEEPFLFGLFQSTVGSNIISLGGSSALGNAATLIDFYTAANNTTPTGTHRMRVDSSGQLGIGTGTGSITALLDVNSDLIRVRTSKTPGSASATGNAGDICWDSNYVYVCVAANTWKRAALATW